MLDIYDTPDMRRDRSVRFKDQVHRHYGKALYQGAIADLASFLQISRSSASDYYSGRSIPSEGLIARLASTPTVGEWASTQRAAGHDIRVHCDSVAMWRLPGDVPAFGALMPSGIQHYDAGPALLIVEGGVKRGRITRGSGGQKSRHVIRARDAFPEFRPIFQWDMRSEFLGLGL